MLDLIGPFIFGLAGSGHCLGMCGPLVLAYSLHLRVPDLRDRAAAWPASATHHAAFHTGRLFTYGLLGAAAAGIAGTGAFHHPLAAFRSTVSLGGGGLMVVFGVCMLGTVPLRLSWLPVAKGPFAPEFFRRLFSSKRLAAKFSLGLVAGCLPCMLSLAMVVKAATTGRPFLGFLTMLSFGLGTLPALFFTGLSASLLSFRVRLLGERVAAGMVIVMGLILIVKGLAARGLL
jgi:hypothetical protein